MNETHKVFRFMIMTISSIITSVYTRRVLSHQGKYHARQSKVLIRLRRFELGTLSKEAGVRTATPGLPGHCLNSIPNYCDQSLVGSLRQWWYYVLRITHYGFLYIEA